MPGKWYRSNFKQQRNKSVMSWEVNTERVSRRRELRTIDRSKNESRKKNHHHGMIEQQVSILVHYDRNKRMYRYAEENTCQSEYCSSRQQISREERSVEEYLEARRKIQNWNKISAICSIRDPMNMGALILAWWIMYVLNLQQSIIMMKWSFLWNECVSLSAANPGNNFRPVKDPPELVKYLLTEQVFLEHAFRQNIRKYNIFWRWIPSRQNGTTMPETYWHFIPPSWYTASFSISLDQPRPL